MPDMIYTTRAKDFMSSDMKQYLHSKGVATSNTSQYNSCGNGMVERMTGTLWKAIEVTLHSRKMCQLEWELVLPDALYSIRSLLCTATNTTSHEGLFNLSRKTTSGKSITLWLVPGPVKIHAHKSK